MTPLMSSFVAKKLDNTGLPGDNPLHGHDEWQENQTGNHKRRRNRPQAHRRRWRTGLAAGGFRRHAIHGGRPGSVTANSPGHNSATGQGLVLPAKANGIWAQQAQPCPDSLASGSTARGFPGRRWGGKRPRIYHAERGPGGGGDRWFQPAAADRRKRNRDPHTPAGVMAGAFR